MNHKEFVMKKIKENVIALALALGCLPALAQTTNPASTKPNQNTQPATNTNPTTDKSVSPNTNNAAPTRTDSVTTIPKDGTSITTAPGTKKEKTARKATPAKNKKTNPR